MDGLSVSAEQVGRQEVFWTWIDGMVRQLVTELAEKVLTLEMEGHLGAGWNERTQTRCGYRNGCYRRQLTTPHGRLSVRVPRFRDGGLALLKRRRKP